MEQPKPVLRSAVLAWSIGLGLLFVIGYQAVAVLGTKSSNTFSYVTPPVNSTEQLAARPTAVEAVKQARPARGEAVLER